MVTDKADIPFPLTAAAVGMTITLLEIRAAEKLRQRLDDVGLQVGMRVRVVKNSGGFSPLILALEDDTRLAINHGMAQKVMVGLIREERMVMDKTDSSASFPLAFAATGATVTLLEVRAGKKLRQRLSDLGLHVGMQARVVKSGECAQMILAVKNDTRLALGHGLAQKIMVKQVQEDN